MSEIVEGTCQLRAHRGTVETPSVWESPRPRESQEEWEKRHLDARILCHACPEWSACEQRLTEYELEGKAVDGVVAGRYSDIGIHGNGQMKAQKDCRACRRRMRAQKLRDDPLRPGDRQHEGEGLCHVCHPRLSRIKTPQARAD